MNTAASNSTAYSIGHSVRYAAAAMLLAIEDDKRRAMSHGISTHGRITGELRPPETAKYEKAETLQRPPAVPLKIRKRRLAKRRN